MYCKNGNFCAALIFTLFAETFFGVKIYTHVDLWNKSLKWPLLQYLVYRFVSEMGTKTMAEDNTFESDAAQ